MTQPPLLILIDGSSYLYRAFHALPPLVNSKGEPSGAIYGVMNMIKKLLNDYSPQYVAVIFDAKGKTFRDDLYEDYKAHRDAMPDDLVTQVEPLKEIIQAWGLPLLTIENVEADDVIGTLTASALKKKWQVLISTGDKDMTQLVNPRVSLINTMTNTLLDSKGVQEKFGLPPECMIDYLSLVGDSSDNIPGIPGVGPKTAIKWLLEYDSVKNLLKHADKIPGKVGERLRENKDKIDLWKTLVTIKQDVPLKIKIDDLTQKDQDIPKLIKLFKHYDFKNWVSTLEKNEKFKENSSTSFDFKIINSEKDFEILLKKLNSTKSMGIQVHTSLPDDPFSKLISVSLFLAHDTLFYLPCQDKDDFRKLKNILENTEIKKWGHNLKFCKTALENNELSLEGIAQDIMVEDYLLHPAQNRHDLDFLVSHYLKNNKISYESIAGKGQKKLHFEKIPIEKAAEYTTQALSFIADLQKQFESELQAIPELKKVYTHIELPLIATLSRMEFHGVLIDEDLLKEQSKELEKRLRDIEHHTYKLAGRMFNIASPKQLQEVLYDHLKLPILQRTATGQASTAEEVLQILEKDYPLPKFILEHRTLSKLKSTYTDALPLQINPKTQRIHTSYNQTGTSTGRLSSSHPNLQNIPIRNEEGRRIRKAFIAPPGYFIVSADYSQIELRIMAHFSQDPKLLHAFSNGTDIHRATAAEVFGVKPEDVTPEQRRQAKVINFGILYGMSAFGLAKELGTTRELAQNYIHLYFTRYSAVHDYIEKIRKLAHKQGFVETAFGRRIYVPDINDRNMQRQKAAERAAINGPLQGTAADVIKRAMNTLDHWIIKDKNHTHMIMQVHDELVFEVPEAQLDHTIKKIREYMTHAFELSVPIVVQINHGKNWEEAH